MNIGLGITGSFCTYKQILETAENLTKNNHNVIPIVSNAVLNMDTRFGKAEDFILKLKEITGNEIVSTIVEAEPLGPKNVIDVLAIAPCTGNTLSKLANGISDDAVTMSAKAHMRNYKPLVISVSTNDGLGLNLQNIAKLLNEKDVYFVPFRQDDPIKKPKSLISDLNLLEKTIESAVKHEQIQPLLLSSK